MAQEEKGFLGNTKPRTRSRKYCFTLNNWTEEEYGTIIKTFEDEGIDYIIGKEIGAEGTPHLQGFINHKNPIDFNTIKRWIPRAHIEKAKGTLLDNKRYCSKEGNFITNIPLTPEEKYDMFMKELYEEVKWYEWQEEILELIKKPADLRKVYWFYDENGNKGKSFLARYIDWKYDAIIANGRQADVFNQYKLYLEEKKRQPGIAIIDIPRSHRDYICYSTFEKIKDGLFYSGKYEGGKLRLTPHHLIIFANFKPEIDKLSNDRWVIRRIDE